MANGTDSEEFVEHSTVRPGLKRELAFALKAQSEICGGELGRTRSRRARSDSPGAAVSSRGRNKLLKKSSDGSGEERGEADKLGFAAGKTVGTENEATGDLEDGERKKSVSVVESAGDLISEEEGKSDVVDVDDEPERMLDEDLSSEKAEINVDVGGAEALHSRQEEEETVRSEKSSRRFTRSSLKPKEEQVEKFEPKGGNVDENRLGDEVPVKLEMKMSKKIGLRHPFVALKDFLDTGLLEGFHVKYCRGPRQGRAGLVGVIKGNGILCSCKQCKGVQVVSPNIFELHAGSSNKRPPEYIFLENGKTLRDVMNAVKDSPLETLEEAVQAVLGTSSINKCTICMNCEGSLAEAEEGKTALLCKICLELRESCTSPCQVADATDLSQEVQDTADEPKGPNVADRSEKVLDSPKESRKARDAEWSPEPSPVRKSSASSSKYSSHIKSHGRLTRKDLRLHKMVFEDDVLPDGTEVAYYSQGKKMLVGYKKGYGIFCTCCESEISASQFEAHAGFASRRKPYDNIYTSNGVSLHELSLTLAKTRRLSTIENDDLCSFCFDGGDLLCCDTCPRAFHLECIHLSSLPRGGWNCRYCEYQFQKERYVERSANALAAGRVAGADAIQQITNRCIRIVRTPETDIGGCALCRSHAFTKSGFGPRTVIICDQCQKEFHVGCLKDHKMAVLKELPEGKWFCCTDCERIHSALESYVVRGEEKLPDSLMDVIRMKLVEKGLMSVLDFDIRWRFLNGKMDFSDESRRLLVKSVSIFHEQFGPIKESAAGRDLIPAMVYGNSWKGQEFSGMFCIVLTVNGEVVSAGLLRIFGEEVAELPLVATSSDCQGQGYFQALFTCMESVLTSFNVKKLVLPAAEEAESIWTKKFGFDKIVPEELRELRRKYHMMIFQGTSVLQKLVCGSKVDVDGGSERTAE